MVADEGGRRPPRRLRDRPRGTGGRGRARCPRRPRDDDSPPRCAFPWGNAHGRALGSPTPCAIARDGTGLRLAAGLGRPVVSVEYPLAPEERFPVAIEHCLAAYEAGVRERGPQVLLGGVSAGANLALGVLQRVRALRESGSDLPQPVGLVGLTPFGDLAGEGDSYRVNEGRDAYLRWRGQQERFARAYAGRADLRDPLVSPVHADWSGEPLPPAIFTTGTRDLFLSDTARIHTAWRAAGGEADLVLAEGMWHSYLSDARLPESDALMARLLDWCDGVLAGQV
ncbi:alpha/beta hydrolase fold domain-containing protein [Janibacter sp. YAF2_2]|uniref:alpha/beta hydrolase fold domain-containing protein n=1 Tax=Janibacter sp. YAF2_2 TaxID=3233079 RepID=UPI003F93B58D